MSYCWNHTVCRLFTLASWYIYFKKSLAAIVKFNTHNYNPVAFLLGIEFTESLAYMHQMMYKNVCGSLVCNSKMLKTTKIAIENRTECVIASWWTINNIDEFHKDSIRQKNPKPRRTNIELFHLHAVLEKSKLKDQ